MGTSVLLIGKLPERSAAVPIFIKAKPAPSTIRRFTNGASVLIGVRPVSDDWLGVYLMP